MKNAKILNWAQFQKAYCFKSSLIEDLNYDRERRYRRDLKVADVVGANESEIGVEIKVRQLLYWKHEKAALRK